jgi:predicted dehydrogenase
MKVGIAGVGFMGSMHAAGWKATAAKIAGFCGETVEECKPIAAQYQTGIFQDFKTMLSAVDIVDICTPTHLHFDMVLQAAAAGKHIICEKPLALTIQQGQEMIAVCKKAGVHFYVAHVVRFFPEYALAQNTVASGQIGNIGEVRLSRGSFRPKKPVGNWFLDEKKSGGMMLDLMIHDFDYARLIGGNVESVFAKKITTGHPDAPVDYGVAVLKHHVGTISHIVGAWAYPPPTFRTSFEISGDAGMIDFSSEGTAPILNLIQKLGADAPDVGLPASPVIESPYTTQIKEFYNAIVENKAARVSAEDGLAAVQIALAAIESANTGKAVYLPSLPEVSA